jgi:ribosomal protein S18 acetylase RimI-like enzyme
VIPVTLPVTLAVTLAHIERYYDAVPRPVSTTEEVGPFTLFLADEGTGWELYARPRLGLDENITSDDVRRLFDRQVELGRPRNIEWVRETTPSLLPAVRNALGSAASAGSHVDLELCPLLVLPPATGMEAGMEAGTEAGQATTRVLTPHDPDLPITLGAVHAAFDGSDDVLERPVGKRPDLIERGLLVVVAAYDDDGRVVGGGSAAPRGDAAELMGIGVPPFARKHGLGSAITRALVAAVRAQGATTVLLSAASDSAASIYRQVGFEDIGTACILEVP